MTTKTERRQAVDDSIASIRLAGMEPSDEAKAIMERFVEGEIGILEAIDTIKEMHGL